MSGRLHKTPRLGRFEYPVYFGWCLIVIAWMTYTVFRVAETGYAITALIGVGLIALFAPLALKDNLGR